MIGNELLEKNVIRTRITKSDSSNENDDQITTLIRDLDDVKEEGAASKNHEAEELSDTAIVVKLEEGGGCGER
jgi:predicted transcriptional regulator YheO